MSSFISPLTRSPRSDDHAIERSLQAQAVSGGAARAALGASVPRGTLPPGVTVVHDVQESLAADPDGRRGGAFEHHPVEGPLETQTDGAGRRAQSQAAVVARAGDPDPR